MSKKILDALAKLNPANDNHWTADGAPRIDTVKMISGDQGITRDDITQAAPLFSRSNTASLGTGADSQVETAPASPQAAQPTETDQQDADTDTIDSDEAPIDTDAAVETDLAAVQREISETNLEINKLKRHLAKLQEREAELYDLTVESKSQSAQRTIQEYLANQRRINEQRVRQELSRV